MWQEHWFDPDSVFHLREPDPNQEIYGVPEYLSAMQSAWLNENATLFRRRYYKNVTRDDILAAHRVPPQLMGVMPNVTGGFGAVKPVAEVFVKNELEPLQMRFAELNDWIGEDVMRFGEYTLSGD